MSQPDQPQLKGILFDMDDTLIDWSGFGGEWYEIERPHLQKVYTFLVAQGRTIAAGFDRFFRHYRESVKQAWADARGDLRSPHLGRILMSVLADFGIAEDDHIEMRRCLEAYQWRAIPGVSLFEDVPPILDQFQAAGLQLGIITNAFQPIVLRDIELRHFDLLRYFPDQNLRITAADVGYLKPHPTIFHHALNLMHASADEVIFVGDNPVADIAGAQGVGMKAILRVNHGVPPLISGLIIPDHAINTFAELPSVLDAWYGGWR